MPKFDIRCLNLKCEHQAEVFKAYAAKAECSQCGGECITLMPNVLGIHGFGKQPYDYLDGPVPDSKPIKSFAHDRRKGGKDRS